MRAGSHRVVLATAGVLCAAASSKAQTTDPIFRSWRWSEEITSPRVFALGGAVTGLADDGAAAVVNPAGLSTLPRAGEILVGVRFRGDVTLPSGDLVHSLTKISSPSTFALRLGSRVGLNYYVVEPRSASRISYSDSASSGALRTSISGPGVGLGVRVSPYLNLGLSLSALRLYVNEGTYLRQGAAGMDDLRVRLETGGNTRVGATIGALRTNPAGDLAFGLAYRFGGSWRAVRTAVVPATRASVDEGTEFAIQMPSVLSGGVSWQPRLRRAERFLLTVQADQVFLGGIEPTAPPGLTHPAGDYGFTNSFEWRTGTEFTFPILGRWSSHGPGRPNRVQLRAGFRHAAAGTLVYHGSDPSEQAVFPATDSRDLWTLGASIGASTIWRISAAYQLGKEQQLVIGLALRYPGLFP